MREFDKPPLLPMLGALIWQLALTFELFGLSIHLATRGARPVQGKLWALTLATVIAAICHLLLKRIHSASYRHVRRMHLSFTDSRSWAIVGTLVCYFAFIGWVFV